MLIQPKAQIEGSVVTIRLVSGEELIGKCEQYTPGGVIRLSKPVVVHMQMVSPGQAGLAFAPFMASVEEGSPISIPVENLVAQPLPTRKDVAAGYIKSTTGLEVPGAGLKF